MGAEAYLPSGPPDLDALRAASARCEGCDLYRRATQTVFGSGARHSPVMLVGEQPGDREDREGRPFVGPAGHLLDQALAEAGLAPDRCYVTNAVKHFKWEARGKVRLHKKPSAAEVRACKPWLLAEIEAVEPAVVVCLGATAAQCLLGSGFRVTRQRGQVLDGPAGTAVVATVHPASVLRAPDEAGRRRAFEGFVADLCQVASHLEALSKRSA